MTTCLLVIDVQLGMFQGQKVPKVWNDEPLLGNILELIDRARAACVPIVFVQHAGNPHEILAPTSLAYDMHPSIVPRANEAVVIKRRPNAFLKTKLNVVLNELQVEHIVACGIQTDACVDSTCRAASDLGYRVTLVSDAHSTWDNKALTAAQIVAHHNATLKDYDFVQLCTTAEAEFPIIPGALLNKSESS